MQQRLSSYKKSMLKNRIEHSKIANHMPLKKSESEEQKEEKKIDHPFSSMPVVAVLTKRGCQYSQNGYQYLASGKGGNRKKIYDTSETCYQWFGKDSFWLSPGCRLDKGTLKANFNPRANYKASGAGKMQYSGQRFPYSWQGHHILPANCFYSGSKKAFTPETKTLLLRVAYDINHGQNIIMLPGRGQNYIVPVHALLHHYSDHPRYNKDVISKLTSIHEQLEKILKDKKACETVIPDILNDLIRIQDLLFNKIVVSSRVAVNTVIKNNVDDGSDDIRGTGLHDKNKHAGDASSQGPFPRLG